MKTLLDHYRCPEEFVAVATGDCRSVDDFRLERYSHGITSGAERFQPAKALQWLYYGLRPMLTDGFRSALQRLYLRNRQRLAFPRWPVDTTVEEVLEQRLILSMREKGLDEIPFIWFWPDGAPASAIITHDVERTEGADFVTQLMDIDDEFGMKASFQIVPEKRYEVTEGLLNSIRDRQFEINVHGLDHDGNLFRERERFRAQSRQINRYVRSFQAEGFRSPCMYRNVEWFEDLDIQYDMSVPNVAHLEPQRGGCCTVFPYFVGSVLELPLTTTEDYTLFHILGTYSTDLWKSQIGMIMNKHGLISILVHPDYVIAERPRTVYRQLLSFLSALRSEGNIWIARPGEVNRWWRARSEMRLTRTGEVYRVEGRGSERARIAFARLRGEAIEYVIGAGAVVQD